VKIDGGLQTVILEMPAIVTTDLPPDEGHDTRSLPNIMKARKKPMEKPQAEDLA